MMIVLELQDSHSFQKYDVLSFAVELQGNIMITIRSVFSSSE